MIGVSLGGRYEIKEVIGQGGFAVVYRALQTSIDRDVAIKVLTLDASQDESIGRRFEAEAKIISQLRHPNTLKLIDFGQTDDNRIYLVMELLQGAALDEVVRGGPLPPRQVVSILKQSTAALEEAHDLGVVHRDIKPGNIFVEQVGRRQVVKVLDFGIAKVHSEQSNTMTGQMFGTPLYMSPEQVKCDTVDGRSDLYSLGVVAYQCLTGQVPFDGATPYSILMKHANDPPPSMLSVNPAMIHSDVEGLVSRLLSKDPNDRPATASDLLDELDALDAILKAKGEPDPNKSSGDSLAPVSIAPVVNRNSQGGGSISSAPQSGATIVHTTGSNRHTATMHSGQQSMPSGQQTQLSDSFELPVSATKSSKKTMLIVAVILALSAGGSAAYFLTKDKGQDPVPKAAPKQAAIQIGAPAKSQTSTPVAASKTAKQAPPKPTKKQQPTAPVTAEPPIKVAAPKIPDAAPPKKLAMVDPSPPKVVKKPSPNERRLRTLLKQAGASMKAKRLVKAEKQYRRWLTLAGNKHPGAAKVRRKLKSVSKRLRSPPVIRRPKVARIKVTLSPKKAVYALTDRPRAKAVAYDAAGKVVKGVRSLKWSVIGKAKLKDNHLRFKSESRGKIKACIGRVCGVARYMSLDDTGLP